MDQEGWVQQQQCMLNLDPSLPRLNVPSWVNADLCQCRSELTHGSCWGYPVARELIFPYCKEASSEKKCPAGYSRSCIGADASLYLNLVRIGLIVPLISN